jgi:hypothetical protein
MIERKFRERDLPECVKQSKKDLDTLSFFQIFLTDDQLLSDILRLFDHDIMWLKLVQQSQDTVESELKDSFQKLSNDLINITLFFKEKLKEKNILNNSEIFENEESPNPVEDEKEIKEEVKDFLNSPGMDLKKSTFFEIKDSNFRITEDTYQCYISILKVLMSKKDKKNDHLEAFAQQVFKTKGRSLDEKFSAGKFNSFKKDFILHSVQNLSLPNFYKYLKSHFHLFIPKIQKSNPFFVHPLHQNEIALHLNLSNSINLQKIQEFFKIFIGSSKTFKLFMQKNSYYFFIEKALEQEFIFLSELEKQRNLMKGFAAELKIIDSPDVTLKNVVFTVTESGLQQIQKNDHLFDFVKRSDKDSLVVVGKKNSPSFNFDIQLNFNSQDDDLAAVFFLNRNGFNLVDLSTKYSVKVVQESIKINDNLVICLGKKHLFWIEECKGVRVQNQVEVVIVFHSFEGCVFTKKFEDKIICMKQNSEIKIGRDSNCELKLKDSEIQGVHAGVSLKNGVLYLKDFSKGNTYTLLKKRKRIEKGKTSIIFPLFQPVDFLIHDYKFNYNPLTSFTRG